MPQKEACHDKKFQIILCVKNIYSLFLNAFIYIIAVNEKILS